jgi:hypothetical protein
MPWPVWDIPISVFQSSLGIPTKIFWEYSIWAPGPVVAPLPDPAAQKTMLSLSRGSTNVLDEHCDGQVVLILKNERTFLRLVGSTTLASPIDSEMGLTNYTVK